MKKIIFIVLCSLFLNQLFSESLLDKYKKQSQGERNKYQRQVDAELSSYKKQVERERKLWKEHVNKVRSKWGKYTDSTPKAWAEYGNDLNSLSVVDFENNKIEVEVLVDAQNENEAENLIAKRFEQIMAKQDKNTHESILKNQLKINNKPVTKKNSKEFVKKNVKKNYKKEVIIGSDGRARVKVKVSFDLVPNSIKIRAKKYLPLVKKYAKKYKIEPALILGLIRTESAFNPRAFSRRPDGTPMACGLMQLIPTQAARDAHRALYKSDKIVKPEFLYNPETNIKMGVWYINNLKRWWLSREKKWYKKNSSKRKIEYYVISSYNQGMGTIRKYAHRPLMLINKSDSETYRLLTTEKKISHEGRNYLKKVLKYSKEFRGLN